MDICYSIIDRGKLILNYEIDNKNSGIKNQKVAIKNYNLKSIM